MIEKPKRPKKIPNQDNKQPQTIQELIRRYDLENTKVYDFIDELVGHLKQTQTVVSAKEPTGNNREKVWIQKGKNRFDINTMVEFVGKYRLWDSGWYLVETDEYNGIKFPVEPNQTYVFSTDSTDNQSIAFYDRNYNYISGNSFHKGTVFTTPANCYLVSMAVKNDYTWIQVERGLVATTYEAYVEQNIYVLNDNNVYEKIISKEYTWGIYSTDEVRIGTWIDGKPFYRKTIYSTSTSGTIDVNYDFLRYTNLNISVNEYLFPDCRYTGTYGDDVNFCINKNKKVFELGLGTAWSSGLNYIVFDIEYTKTTD